MLPLPEERSLLAKLTLPLNRCNVPAPILASLAYQQYPVSLQLDGIETFYPELFERLVVCPDARQRVDIFNDYMAVRFRLPEAQLAPRPDADPVPRPQSHYRKLLLGWLFDSDSDAGAVWRQWVESRFGLRTVYHHQPISDSESAAYLRYMQAYARASYQTNDLVGQLDLLYCFCQYQLAHLYPLQQHLTLYRGSTEAPKYQVQQQPVLLLNNLSSCSSDVDEAYRFGPKVVELQVPLTKIVCFDTLLPRGLNGEQEYMVLGGIYKAKQVW
jgi:Dinitrogenase reductase ADP-ribosyltransferase (DRAT).